MSDQNIPVMADGDVLIDCDNNNDGTTNVIKFTHNNGTELMRIQENGDVGIGTASPGALLEVNKNHDGITAINLINGSSGGSIAFPSMVIGEDTSTRHLILRYANSGVAIDNSIAGVGGIRNSENIFTNLNADGGLNLTVRANAPIRFFTGGIVNTNERMRIDGSGNVGIGTTNPTEKLDVSGNIKASGTVAAGNEGLKWKVYTYTLTANDDGQCTINTGITASKIRGIQLSIYDTSNGNCIGGPITTTGSNHQYMKVSIGSGTITVEYDKDATYGFTTGDVVNLVVFYEP